MDIQNNSIVTDADTEVLDSPITKISNDFTETYNLYNEQQEELEILVAKAVKLGELYERKNWQESKNQKVAVPNIGLKVEITNPDDTAEDGVADQIYHMLSSYIAKHSMHESVVESLKEVC